MPASPAAAGRSPTSQPAGAHARRAGGTSVAGSPKLPILAAIAAAATVAIALTIWIVAGRGTDASSAPAEPAIEAEIEAEEAGGDAELEAAPPAPRPRAPRNQAPDLGAAAAALAAELRKERLWATVTVDRADPTVLIVQSSLCEDQGVKDTISASSSSLASSGARLIRCVAPHGGVIFEQAP